jgi:hypothetical protein
MGEWMYSSIFSWPGTSWTWVVSLTPRLLYRRKTAPGTHWIGCWLGPRAGLDDAEKRKFLTQPELELRPLRRPVRNQSLYRLRYKSSFFLKICFPVGFTLQIEIRSASPGVLCLMFDKFCRYTSLVCRHAYWHVPAGKTPSALNSWNLYENSAHHALCFRRPFKSTKWKKKNLCGHHIVLSVTLYERPNRWADLIIYVMLETLLNVVGNFWILSLLTQFT